MILLTFIAMSPLRTVRSGKMRKYRGKVQKQDRRRRHGRAAKLLSAHRFARHGRARGRVPLRLVCTVPLRHRWFSPKFPPNLSPKPVCQPSLVSLAHPWSLS